jgi:FixJ family two-component response regulator
MTNVSSSSVPERAAMVAGFSPVTPTVFVVDDDAALREALETLLVSAGWNVELFASAQEFLNREVAAVPRCLILDVNLPDLNGLAVQERLSRSRHEMPIIFITGYGSIPMTVRAMKAGAFEVLPKPFDGEQLLVAVRHAVERSRAALEDEAALRQLRNGYAALTPREREVMALVVTGMLNKQIADQLGIAEITVKLHRGKVMRKMKADSVAALVKMDASLRAKSILDDD